MTTRQRMSATMKAAGAPVVAWPVGLAIVALGCYRIYRHPPEITDWKHVGFDGVVLLIGLLILPGVGDYLVGRVKALLGAIGPYLPWGKKGGGGDASP